MVDSVGENSNKGETLLGLMLLEITPTTALVVYPNPVLDNSVQLQLSNWEKGNYNMTLFNQFGQQVLNRTINHNGGSSNQTVALGNLAAGVYELRLSNGTTVITKKMIKE